MNQPKGMFTFDNSALVLIDLQPQMFDAVNSEVPADVIDLNARFLIRVAKLFDMPIVLSSVGVEIGKNDPTRTSITDEMPGYDVLDRHTMNAWEDPAFKALVEQTGRKRLIFSALWTEICLVYPVISAMDDGYQAMIVVDAAGGTSQIAHQTAIERSTASGAAPSTARAAADELFRDWRSDQGIAYGKEILPWYLPQLNKLSRVAPGGVWVAR